MVHGAAAAPWTNEPSSASLLTTASDFEGVDAGDLGFVGRRLCVEALGLAGNIVSAAQIRGITRHALKRRIIKLDIRWSRTAATEPEPSE